MVSTTNSNLRRSTRARSKPVSTYDDELKKLEESQRRRLQEDSDASDREEEVRQALMDEDDSADEDVVDKEETVAVPRPSRPAPSSKKNKQPKKIVQRKPVPKRKQTTNNKNNKKKYSSVTTSLKALSKQVLESSERPESSLLAALLASSQPIPDIDSCDPRPTSTPAPTTLYTPQLEGISRRLVHDYQGNTNGLCLQAIRLLVRSVGATLETCFADDTVLEDLPEAEWDSFVNHVVQDMTEAGSVLLTAIPQDSKVGTREFRVIYQEFWYRLGGVLLSYSSASTTSHGLSPDLDDNDNDDDDNNDDDKEDSAFSSNRVQVEMMRDLIEHLTEVVMAGQPDVRAAASLAIWQLAQACLERTVELETKLTTAQRQSKAAASSRKGQKLEALNHSIQTWSRHKTELEEIAEGLVLDRVFAHRYRDANPHIRAGSLETLSKLSLLRPDRLLQNKYLKYFGWMLSDKDEMVRLAAIQGLYAPFRALEKKDHSRRPASLDIDISKMQNVTSKFLGRIVDCTEDAESLLVQETAMKLLLCMLNRGFLDEWEDDHGWDQINLKALDPDTSLQVRKDALYFMLDQMDCFDTSDDDATMSSTPVVLTEKKQVERIEGVASWIANKLCDGPIPIDNIKVHLANLVVDSLREMPEHKQLVHNWTAMLKAIRSENPQQGRSMGREELAKQRVLLQMLARTVELEVNGGAPEEKGKVGKSKFSKKRKASDSTPRESLTVALLKSLSHLLSAFKGDILALRAITRLPQYLLSDVFSLPARKTDFQNLLKNLCSLFLEATDEQVLSNISQSLVALLEGDHPCVAEVRMHLTNLSTALQDRLMTLLQDSEGTTSPAGKRSKKRKSRSPRGSSSTLTADSISTGSSAVETEHSLYLCLMRLGVLVQRCQPDHLFDVSVDEDEEMETLFNAISEAAGKRLLDRQPVVSNGDTEESSMVAPDIWKLDDTSIHAEVAKVVDQSLLVLTTLVAWKLEMTLQENASSDDDEVDRDELVVIRMRGRLLKLLGLCFDQFVEQENDVYSDEQVVFANSIQTVAGRFSSDIRTLFPREWAKAKAPVYRALALTNNDDAELIGGFARYMQSRDEELTESDEMEQIRAAHDLLLPLTRALVANWNDGNRKEAGILLAHIVKSGGEASKIVNTTARLLKKINPVRYLEAQMACLQLSFEKWINNEPEDLESDHPTEEEMQIFEESQKVHEKMFDTLEQQAARLSASLGVGKISNTQLSRSLLSFMEEGIRFAFEGERGAEDDLVLGSRLPFLLVLAKYSVWVKKNRGQLEGISKFVFEMQTAMEAHPEHDDVHEDDLSALESFKNSLGISGYHSRQDDSIEASGDGSLIATPSPGRLSTGSKARRNSTAGTIKSRVSNQSTLSPLQEEGNDNDDETLPSPSPQKRRRLASSLSTSATIEE